MCKILISVAENILVYDQTFEGLGSGAVLPSEFRPPPRRVASTSANLDAEITNRAVDLFSGSTGCNPDQRGAADWILGYPKSLYLGREFWRM